MNLLRAMWRDPYMRPLIKFGVVIFVFVLVAATAAEILEVRAAGWDWDCMCIECRKELQ